MKKYLLMTTVAGVALFAGAAQAADIQPIVVPVVVTPPVVVPGPVYRIEIDADVAKTDAPGFETGLSTAVDVRTASGFGFKLEVIGGLYFNEPNPVETDIAVIGRLYHTVGANGTIGVFGTFNRGGPVVTTNTSVGLDADYVTEALTVNYSLQAGFDAGAFEALQSILALELERGEHIRIKSLTLAVVPAGGPFVAVSFSEFGYRLGPVTPFIQLGAGYVFATLTGSVGVGVDLELPVGDTPLTITGGVLAAFTPGGFGWEANVGFEYNPNDGPLTLKGELAAFDGGNWQATLGIGVAFGDGRISGFGSRVLENFAL